VAVVTAAATPATVAGWTALLAACGLCYLLKLAGYLAPPAWLERPRVMRIAGLVTVALLSALVAVQSFATGHRLALDARVAALAVAAVLLWRRAPFIVVVVAGALVAAGLRAMTG
jgi:Branched-chain amino acid transport protein (AzlD)